ncbi:hypothetical protein MEX01_47760 [Methylorubrum extorquens]|uniref:hypothetical protein n=1 Tax=Methylorubrum extorquens TaxID=408 RepID=UPI001172331F|nr:hypothetical protein [Methylorubrum extorquens]GEL44185.1 hypothetical protein MEX01_47760 [Methylorubrum extorquens]
MPILPLISLAIQFAPALLGILAGDTAGSAAGKIISTVKEVLGTADPAEAQAKLAADPSLGEALSARLNAQVETLRIEMADVANARAMGLGLVEAKHWTGNMPAIVVLIIIAVHTAMNAAIFLIPGEIPDRMFQLLTAAYGTSSTAFGIAIAYYLGSSRSSVTKDAQIGQALNAAVANGNVVPLRRAA